MYEGPLLAGSAAGVLSKDGSQSALAVEFMLERVHLGFFEASALLLEMGAAL